MHIRTLTVLACVFGFVGCFNPSGDEDSTGADGSTSNGDGGNGNGDGATQGMSGGPTGTSNSSTGMPTSGPTQGTADSTADGSDTATDTTGPPTCLADEVCVPAIPVDWSGPIALGNRSAACPATYPTTGEDINEGLVPGIPQCSCGCNVGSVTCQLFLENEGIDFNPVGSCDDPPFDDECLSAVVNATCVTLPVDVPATPTWTTTTRPCGGAQQGGACDGGNCFPDASDHGQTCIVQDGDHACPPPFDDRILFHRGLNDTRLCTACTCSVSGQSCQIDVEICSVGFFDVTLVSGGACEQLNSGDGDGVTLMSSSVTNVGTCTPGAASGQVQGDVTETDPVTACCLP